MNAAFKAHLLDELANFETYGLKDLKNASLMNRIDTKFIVPLGTMPTLLRRLEGFYTVLKINDQRVFRYHSTYFDTPDLSLYHLHHNKRLNRHKVRTRTYLDDGSQYLEVKFKSNKKRTLKTRLQLESDCGTEIHRHQEFLNSTGLPTNFSLTPSLISQYKRIAFASELRSERLTLDFDLTKQCLALASPKLLRLGGFAIAELKQNRLDRKSPFFQLARELGLRATSFSKYCMGIALTMPNHHAIKSNRFKKTTRKLAHHTIEEA